MTMPEKLDRDIPPLVDQHEPPYGMWRVDRQASHEPDLGYMVWESYGTNPDGRMRPLYDQAHETGSWWAGRGETMRWQPDVPAPNPMPGPSDEEIADA